MAPKLSQLTASTPAQSSAIQKPRQCGHRRSLALQGEKALAQSRSLAVALEVRKKRVAKVTRPMVAKSEWSWMFT